MNFLKCSFISVLFLICVTTEVSSACTWQLRDSCYHYVKQKEQFWAAEAHCNTNYNGHLLAINSQEENDFILTRLMETHNLESTTSKIIFDFTKKKDNFIDDNHFWIGAIEDEDVDGLWKWTSGTYPNTQCGNFMIFHHSYFT